ncbi:unnamed protein product [Trifolium pratense]|uniref:Uncharacterized protein n=1 Tax=Trifolium pratense TaxID=57577 RepID=A0ACB0IRT2_TRIPR|nr:unnamed protein product [Trifolium pratense]
MSLRSSPDEKRMGHVQLSASTWKYRHEIVGIVTKVGSKVEKFKVGDKVGVGYIIDSCRSCQNCTENLESYCPQHIPTCGAKYRDGITYGGYSDSIVVDEHFIVHIPDGLPLEVVAVGAVEARVCLVQRMQHSEVVLPLTLKWLDKPGLHIGVVGLGGLGHMAVKFAKAFGANVTVISTSPNKEKEAIEHLGADSFLISQDQAKMQATMGTLDGIIDTVSADHPLLPLIGLLKSHGKLVMVGAPMKPMELHVFPLLLGRKMIVGSFIGGMKGTSRYD